MGGMKNVEINVADYLAGALSPVDILDLAELLAEVGVPEALGGRSREAVERLAYIGRHVEQPQRDAAEHLAQMQDAGPAGQIKLKLGQVITYAETASGYMFVVDRTAVTSCLRRYERMEWRRKAGEIFSFTLSGPYLHTNWKWTGVSTLAFAQRCARELLF